MLVYAHHAIRVAGPAPVPLDV